MSLITLIISLPHSCTRAQVVDQTSIISSSGSRLFVRDNAVHITYTIITVEPVKVSSLANLQTQSLVPQFIEETLDTLAFHGALTHK